MDKKNKKQQQQKSRIGKGKERKIIFSVKSSSAEALVWGIVN